MSPDPPVRGEGYRVGLGTGFVWRQIEPAAQMGCSGVFMFYECGPSKIETSILFLECVSSMKPHLFRLVDGGAVGSPAHAGSDSGAETNEMPGWRKENSVSLGGERRIRCVSGLGLHAVALSVCDLR